jgi:hypothetical protein
MKNQDKKTGTVAFRAPRHGSGGNIFLTLLANTMQLLPRFCKVSCQTSMLGPMAIQRCQLHSKVHTHGRANQVTAIQGLEQGSNTWAQTAVAAYMGKMGFLLLTQYAIAIYLVILRTW